MFFAASLEVIAIRFSEDKVIMENLVFLKKETETGGPTTILDKVRRAMWAILCADDAGVVSMSADGLDRMMTINVEVFREFGLTVSEKKTEVLLMRVKEEPGVPPHPPLIIEAAGQRYAQTAKFRYLGALLNEYGDLTQAINCNIKAAWACFSRYSRELFDRPGAPFRLNPPDPS